MTAAVVSEQGVEKFENRKEVRRMKKSIPLLSNLLLSSTLFWGVPVLGAEETIVKVPADTTSYCHQQFPPMLEESLNWERPVFDTTAGNIIDFYGSCDYDPVGRAEIRAQKQLLFRGLYGDGD
jgi:hypothetical protein